MRQLKEQGGAALPDVILELFLHDSQIASPLDLRGEALPSCTDVLDTQNEEWHTAWPDALSSSGADQEETEVRIVSDVYNLWTWNRLLCRRLCLWILESWTSWFTPSQLYKLRRTAIT